MHITSEQSSGENIPLLNPNSSVNPDKTQDDNNRWAVVNNLETTPHRSLYHSFTRWLIYNKAIYKSCTNPENKGVKFFDGLGFGVHSLWPIVFSTTFIIDVIQLSQQNETYGDTFAGLLIGTSTDPSMLSTNYGNYAPGSFRYWVFPSLFAITPFTIGFLNIGFGWASERFGQSDEVVAKCLVWLGSPSVRRRAFHNEVGALQELREVRESGTILKSLFADYRLWSIGEAQNTFIIRQTLFWLFNIAIYIAIIAIDGRIVQQMAMRILYACRFASAKNACEKQNRVYTFLQQLGDYKCSICGDWSQVYTQDVFSSQGCLDGLTAVSQPYKVLASGIKRLARFGGIKTIDLSQQQWPDWNVEQWQSLLDQIASTTQHLSLLNISLPLNQAIMPDVNKANSMGQFLNKVSVETLDLHNTWNGSVLVNSICSATKFSGLTYLDLSYCQIEDGIYVNNISMSLPTSIMTLKMRGNLITDQGCNQGLYNLRNSNLRIFDISYNQLQGLSFPSSKTMVPQNLTSIDYSSNDFSQAGLSSFWQLTCDNSTITHVSLQSTSLSDIPVMTAAEYIAQTSITDFNFADNAITDYGISQFVPSLVNTSVTTIDFSGNNLITQAGFDFMGPYFINTNLKTVRFANIPMSYPTLSSLLPSFLNTTIETVSLSSCLIGDNSSEMISQWVCRPGNPVKVLDVSQNQITSLDGNILRGNLTSLILNGNKLSQQTILNILNNLPGGVLKELGLNNVGLINSTGKLWSTALPNSSLEVIDVGNNFLFDEGTVGLADELIKFSPEIKALASARIGLKFIRWLANEAMPNTQLKVVNIENNGFTASGGRAVCRAIPGSRIPFKNIYLTPNSQVNSNQINLHSCRFNQINFPGNSELQPHYSYSATPHANNISAYALVGLSTLGIAGLVILALVGLYFLYRFCRVVTPKVNVLVTQNFGFFAKSKSDSQNTDNNHIIEVSQTL